MSLRKRTAPAEDGKKRTARGKYLVTFVSSVQPPTPLTTRHCCSFSGKPKVFPITAYNRRHFIMKVKSLDFIIAKNLSFGRRVEGKNQNTTVYRNIYCYKNTTTTEIRKERCNSEGRKTQINNRFWYKSYLTFGALIFSLYLTHLADI